MTMLYNKHSDLDQIDTTFYSTNDDGTRNFKLVDSLQLGIVPQSLSDIFNFSYGDPFDPKVPWRNPIEREVIEILGKLLGFEDMSGYVTSSECEANFSCLWWCKLNLLMQSRNRINELKLMIENSKMQSKVLNGVEDKNKRNSLFYKIYQLKKQLKIIEQPVIICSRPPFTDVSIIRAAKALGLKTCFVEVNEDGSMNTQSLKERLSDFLQYQAVNFIVSLNLGTQIGGSFDNLLNIRNKINEILEHKYSNEVDSQELNYNEDKAIGVNLCENWKFVYHGDALLYGLTLPILRQLGEKTLRENGLDTISVSLCKFLGSQIPSAAAITYKDFTDNAFKDDNFIEYVSITNLCSAYLENFLNSSKPRYFEESY
ncbi:histidine decarboxylase [Stylonychia lemnae]|uniref:sphinganine-1-phosphate aldolase n=1 Tax=Stylonychia lemnae TaxID=5949 RepID=A0A078AWT8_STYLE|nr:histidine decarboxylase [Stylonychia lemnae]|eukprot:CDW85722.1 histidine decarboxylase [Stylonychia lemnae]